MSSYYVTSDYAFDADGESQIYSVKIQTDRYELNIFISPSDIELLHKISSANWEKRETIALGQSAGSNVFWCADENSLSIMVGHDDESWDFSITLPLQALEDISKSLHWLHEA